MSDQQQDQRDLELISKMEHIHGIIDESMDISRDAAKDVTNLIIDNTQIGTKLPFTLGPIEELLSSPDAMLKISELTDKYHSQLAIQINRAKVEVINIEHVNSVLRFIARSTAIAVTALKVEIDEIVIDFEIKTTVHITPNGTRIVGLPPQTAAHIPGTIFVEWQDITDAAEKIRAGVTSGHRHTANLFGLFCGHEVFHEFIEVYFPQIAIVTQYANRLRENYPSIYENDLGERLCTMFGMELIRFQLRELYRFSCEQIKTFVETGEKLELDTKVFPIRGR